MFRKNIQPILPPDMRKSSDKITPLGTGKLQELKLNKVKFTGDHFAVDSLVGDQLTTLMSDIVSINKKLKQMRKEITNASNTNKALDLLLGLGQLEEAQIIIILKDYVNLLFARIFTQGGLLYIASDSDLEHVWRARLDDVKKNSIVLDKTYEPLAEALAKELNTVIDIIKAKVAADKYLIKDEKSSSIALMAFAAWPMQAKLVVNTVDNKLPTGFKLEKLSDSSRDALILIKYLNNLLKNLINTVENYNS